MTLELSVTKILNEREISIENTMSATKTKPKTETKNSKGKIMKIDRKTGDEIMTAFCRHSDVLMKFNKECQKLHKQNSGNRQLQELADDVTDILEYEEMIFRSLMHCLLNPFVQRFVHRLYHECLKNSDVNSEKIKNLFDQGKTKGPYYTEWLSTDEVTQFLVKLQIEKLQSLQDRLSEIASGQSEQLSLASLEKLLEDLLQQSIEARDIYVKYCATEIEAFRSYVGSECKCSSDSPDHNAICIPKDEESVQKQGCLR